MDLGFSQAQQEEIYALMKQKGIIVETDLPEKGKPQSFLELGYEKVNIDKVAASFFGEDAEPSIQSFEGGKNYTFGSEQLIIMENGIITYFNSFEKTDKVEYTQEQALKTAEDFISKRGGLPENAILHNITYDDKSGGYLIEYVRSHDGFFIANSYIDIIVTPAGVNSYYQCWLKPYGYQGKKREVILPAMAVLRVKDIYENSEPLTITKIEQGYYSRFFNADRWQAAPVWRIQLKSGENYYINAFTGELEQ